VVLKTRLVFAKAQASKIQKLFRKQNLLDTLWVQQEWGLGDGEPSCSKAVELIFRTVQLDLNWVQLVFKTVQLYLNWVELVFRIVRLDLNWGALWLKPVEPAPGPVQLGFSFRTSLVKTSWTGPRAVQPVSGSEDRFDVYLPFWRAKWKGIRLTPSSYIILVVELPNTNYWTN
jgi:hypothetical protein